MMDAPLKQEISEIIARLPEWVRRDLNAKDSTIRERAEDALTAMMLNAMHVAKPD
ncbi:hypothetical protein M2333_000205 [Sphingobium sp. B11D3B]|uniref:DUF6771 family protein n=1 Tax=Sphingobium sp. B11D3B TaxID=2940575 RepID=UPI002227A2B3|nr:DUF6771 family protein [Sphingobium sp. B11D3B]MCW2387159.1 hypothetical protein [Sphingobium sp. B11D3B]